MAKIKAKAGAKKSGKKAGGGLALQRSPSHLLHRALQLALDIYTEETGPDAVTQRHSDDPADAARLAVLQAA